MNKRDIIKSLEPVPPELAAVKFTLETAADGKSGKLEFESDVKMTLLDFLLALSDYVVETATETYEKNKKAN